MPDNDEINRWTGFLKFDAGKSLDSEPVGAWDRASAAAMARSREDLLYPYKVRDSGKRQEFETGSRRDTREGKGRFDLISPIFEERLALHLEAGAGKYGDRNWEKGQPLMRYLDSAKRHLNKLLQGYTGEDHATAAAWNLMAFIHTQEMLKRRLLPEGLDDYKAAITGVTGG